MRFHLLGSSAGKPVPRPFCSCRVCKVAKSDGGRDRRTRTSMHIYVDDEESGEPRHAVDLSPDTAHHMVRDGFCLDRLEHLIFTHNHSDHLDPAYLNIRATVLSDRHALTPLTLYGSDKVVETLAAALPDPQRLAITISEPIAPLQAFRAGELELVALEANHKAGTYHYVVRADGRTVLLGWDTGWWSEATWEAVADYRFDAVFMECTMLGPSQVDEESGHLNFATLLKMKERLTREGCIEGDTPYITMHIGDNGGLTYAEACDLAEPDGVTVGYDGLWLEL